MSQLLNQEDCQVILERLLKTPDIKLEHYELTSLDNDALGFLGEYFRLELVYRLDGKVNKSTFFIKAPPKPGKMRTEVLVYNKAIEKETYLYDKLFKEFELRRYDMSFVPACYLVKDGSTMVLENLAAEGFQLGKRNQFFDENSCKCVLTSLAKMHGACLTLEMEKSKELGRKYTLNEEHPDLFVEKQFNRESDFAARILDSSTDAAMLLIDMMDEDDQFKADFKNMLQSTNVYDEFFTPVNSPKTICHGDLWVNNILFRYENGTATDCRLIDFQLFRYFYPGFDVMLVLFTNTNEEFRNLHMTKLTEFYYQTLKEVLANCGHDIETVLPLKAYKESLRQFEFPASFCTFVCHTFTYLPVKALSTTVTNDDSFKSLMLSGRPGMCAHSFKTDDLFHNVISQDLYGVYKSLKMLTMDKQKN